MENHPKSTLREYFESIVIAVILALFIRTFVVQAFKIPTGSPCPRTAPTRSRSAATRSSV